MAEITFQKFEGNIQRVWDPSSLDSFHRCPRYYKYSVLDRLRTKGDAVTGFGTLLHDSVEQYDRARVEGKPWAEAVQLAVAHAMKTSRNFRTEAAGFTGKGQNERTRETLVRAIVWYCDQFRDDKMTTAVLPDGTAALEVRFEVPIEGTEYRLSGRLDKLAWLNDSLYVIERKTTAKTLGPWYFDFYNPNTQVTAYIWAARQFLGLPVEGVIIEAFQTAVSFTRIGRGMCTRTADQLAEFERDMKIYIEHAEKFARDEYWPMNESACGNYGGCKFRPVCARPAHMRQAWLDEEFQVQIRTGVPTNA
jgi:hypothetical protein